MNSKKHTKQISIFGGMVLLALGGWAYTSYAPIEAEPASLSLLHKDNRVVSNGKKIYAQKCASCHGLNLEGETNWRQRGSDGYLPAPPHDQNGHTWHHSDDYLFRMTKYGIEKIIGQKYLNNMPAYEGILSDKEIIATLSYIKSTWPDYIQRRHDRLNMRHTTSQR